MALIQGLALEQEELRTIVSQLHQDKQQQHEEDSRGWGPSH